MREERFFDVGYEMGLLAGLTGTRHAAGHRAERLRRSIHTAVVTSGLPAGRAALVLLDLLRDRLRLDDLERVEEQEPGGIAYLRGERRQQQVRFGPSFQPLPDGH